MKNNELNEHALFLLICLIAIAVFSFVVYGITGLRIAAGFILICIPFYMILSNFSFEEGDKLIFSLFMGLTILPSITYIIGFLVSFRIAIILTFFILVALAFAISKYKKIRKF